MPRPGILDDGLRAGVPAGARVRPHARRETAAGRHLLLALIGLAPWIVGRFITVAGATSPMVAGATSPDVAVPAATAPAVVAMHTTATLGGLAGPDCLFMHWFPGVGCPGCGLTRAVALALHGELLASWSLHPAGLLVLLLGAAGAGLHLLAARRGFETEQERQLRGSGRALLLAGLLLPWIARLIAHAAHSGVA